MLGLELLYPLREVDLLPLERRALGLDGGPLLRELLLGAFHLGREVVALEHALENQVFQALDLGLAARDLDLHRLVLAVGLDLHELFLEAAQPRLDERQLLFPAPAGRP